jgi:hypothetical protein
VKKIYNRIKSKLINFILCGRVKPSYEDLSIQEKFDAYSLHKEYSKLNEKIVKIIIGEVIQNYAKNDREVSFARDILTLQNDLLKTYYDIVDKQKQK